MALSIDIGTKQIKVVQGIVKKDAVSITGTFSVKIPNEVAIGTPQTQIVAITDLLVPAVKNNSVQLAQPCSITISDDRFLVRNVSVPKGNPEEVKGMALQEMISAYNIPPTNIVEAQVLSTQDDGKFLVRAASMDRTIVESYRDLITNIRMQPKSLTMHSNSIVRLFRTFPAVNGVNLANKSFMLMDCGMFSCIVHVFAGGAHIASRYLPVGFTDLYYHMSKRSAMAEFSEKSTTYEPTFAKDTEEYQAIPPMIMEQIENFLRRLSDEITKFARTIPKIAEAGVANLFLYGGNSLIPGLAYRLGEAMDISTSVIDNVENVELKPNFENIVYHLNAAAALLNA
ncbi:MAG: pilus assembly protein PilM [Clostridiales bacterium]|jgi:Tfp pilus assembly PilM family ATPase|nr:pilus assembly protein PilM [Clostridiales bacterium]